MAHNGRTTILIVEDDAALRQIVIRILDRGGFATLATGNAAEGLALVREHHGALALAILDMMMPGVSGLDLACDLDREYPELKLLYISGFVDSIAARVLVNRAPEQVLLKPFGERVLLERIHLLLGMAAKREPQSAGPISTAIHDGTIG